jgi:hypothetical protein
MIKREMVLELGGTRWKMQANVDIGESSDFSIDDAGKNVTFKVITEDGR